LYLIPAGTPQLLEGIVSRSETRADESVDARLRFSQNHPQHCLESFPVRSDG
jgi:hypothetical protein